MYAHAQVIKCTAGIGYLHNVLIDKSSMEIIRFCIMVITSWTKYARSALSNEFSDIAGNLMYQVYLIHQIITAKGPTLFNFTNAKPKPFPFQLTAGTELNQGDYCSLIMARCNYSPAGTYFLGRSTFVCKRNVLKINFESYVSYCRLKMSLEFK